MKMTEKQIAHIVSLAKTKTADELAQEYAASVMERMAPGNVFRKQDLPVLQVWLASAYHHGYVQSLVDAIGMAARAEGCHDRPADQ